MNPENLSAEALRLFNSLSDDMQRHAIALCHNRSEEEAVYLAVMYGLPSGERRKLLFSLSRRRWGL